MSQLQNRHGLPEALVAAIKNDPYSKGGAEFSATGLVGPPQIGQLWREHGHEIVEDVADQLWKLLGQAVHVVIERANRTEIREKRLFAEIAGAKISGQLDSHVVWKGKVSDWKLTNAWTVVYGGREDWIPQLNIYAELLAQNGVEPKELEVVALLRNWEARFAEAAKKKNAEAGYVKDAYPEAPVAIFALPLWPQERRLAYIEERVRLHRAAQLGDVQPCSDEERWIRKAGDKPTRCIGWCAVAKWCPQYQAYLAKRASR